MTSRSVLTFGVVGASGRFGTKIVSALSGLGTTLWEADSASDLVHLRVPDWVFIATPNTLHYEQAEHYLRAGANVFVEKPATLSSQSLEDLLALADRFGRRLYIDDVFLYRPDAERLLRDAAGTTFVWHKRASRRHGSLLDRFAYHHLYLLWAQTRGDIALELEQCDESGPEALEFAALINGRRHVFSYRISDDVDDSHVAFGVPVTSSHDNALARMLAAVISGAVSFADNHRCALWTTAQIARLKCAYAPRVAVVGGGIFGSTTAVDLAGQGYHVTLHERHGDLLQEASSINQYRVHHGYHYPRSRETAQECKVSAASFIKRYREAIVPAEVTHRYAIASNHSLTDARQFIAFMDGMALPYRRVTPLPSTDVTVEVPEALFDPSRLVSVVKTRLKAAGVEVILGREATEADLRGFDYTVIATYAHLNRWCAKKRPYQYELCEKPVLKLPDKYRRQSIVVLDGPFMCIDPLGTSDLHVMGNVVHAIHASNIGFAPVVPSGYERLLNRGIITNPPVTHIQRFVDAARQFFPDIDEARHVGSMFTFRTVLPNREADDARPTLIEWVRNDRVVVFSGKICTSVMAARAIVEQLNARVIARNRTEASLRRDGRVPSADSDAGSYQRT